MSDDRTVHAETGYAEVVRYDRAGRWVIEDKSPQQWRTPMKLDEVIEWITDQPEGEVKVHFGLPGGRQFDSRLRYLDEFREASS